MFMEIKEKWLKALRSGDYKQADGQLMEQQAREKSYCCLGVLCDLHREEHPDNSWACWYYLEKENFLPKEVAQWAGLKEEVLIDKGQDTTDGGYDVKLGGGESASQLNDGGYNFEYIASRVEERL